MKKKECNIYKNTEYSDIYQYIEQMKIIMDLYKKIKDTEIFKQFYEEDFDIRIKLEKQQI